jgi:hypothetical protein
MIVVVTFVPAKATPNRNAANSEPKGASRAMLLKMLNGIPGFRPVSSTSPIRSTPFTGSATSATVDFGSGWGILVGHNRLPSRRIGATASALTPYWLPNVRCKVYQPMPHSIFPTRHYPRVGRSRRPP